MNYNLSYQLFWDNNLPVNHRQPILKAFGAVITKPLQWLRDVFFNYVVSGLSYQNYEDSSSTYAIDDVVCNFWIDGSGVAHGDFGVYMCIQATTAGMQPTNSNYWIKINENIFGIDSLNKINAQTIFIEYALSLIFQNSWTALFFNQPSDAGRSTIYIETNTIISQFMIGISEVESSNVVYANGEASQFIMSEATPDLNKNFTVFFPQALFDALVAGIGETSDKTKIIISNFVNLFNLNGIDFSIETY